MPTASNVIRQRWRDRSPEAVERALEVTCPPERGGCGALAGEECVSSSGKPTRTHIPRFEESAARLRDWVVTCWA
jgi:hypothetical protein